MQTEMASPCEAQPKRGEVGGGQCQKIIFLTFSPARFGAGEEQKEWA